jgi:hypothetical protein
MVLRDSIISYDGRMEDVLKRWNNHNIPNHMQMGLFIEGLKPFKVMVCEGTNRQTCKWSSTKPNYGKPSM